VRLAVAVSAVILVLLVFILRNLAADSFHVGTVLLRRVHVMFLIEHGTRRVQLAGITARPAGKRVRNLLTNLEHHADGLKFLIRDRAAECAAAFHIVFTAVGVPIPRSRSGRPGANTIAGRTIARRDCAGQMLITGERHLRPVPGE
jgi:putative transposase